MRPNAVLGLDAHALGAEILGFLEQRARKDPVLDDFLIVVQILNEHVQGAHALLQAVFGDFPLRGRNDARDDVEGPGAVDLAGFGVDGEGDAHGLDRQVGGQPALREFALAQVIKIVGELVRAGTGFARRLEQFVVEALAFVLRPVDSG